MNFGNRVKGCLALLVALELLATGLRAQNVATPPPTMANVAYGKDPAQVLDFWRAQATSPTPVVFYIHGGAWSAGKKTNFGKGIGAVRVGDFLAAGISVVSIEYRFVSLAEKAGIKPPV